MKGFCMQKLDVSCILYSLDIYSALLKHIEAVVDIAYVLPMIIFVITAVHTIQMVFAAMYTRLVLLGVWRNEGLVEYFCCLERVRIALIVLEVQGTKLKLKSIWMLKTKTKCLGDNLYIYWHAKPWIPGGEKSIFTVVIHYWRSPLCQFVRARTIDEYDVTMQVHRAHVTSQISCDDVTMLSQKRPSLATMEKWATDDWL